MGDKALTNDMYAQPLQLPDALQNLDRIAMPASAKVLAAALLGKLSAWGLNSVPMKLAERDQRAWGVEYYVIQQHRQFLVPMVNHLTVNQTLRLELQGQAVDLLDHQRPVDLTSITLEPMKPRLLVVSH